MRDKQLRKSFAGARLQSVRRGIGMQAREARLAHESLWPLERGYRELKF
jgi:hypothetical protein